MIRSAALMRSAWPERLARIVLAILGGYAFTYAFTAALARLLPMARVDALVTASLLSFIVYLAFLLWAFTAASLRRVTLAVAAAIPLAAIGFWPQVLELLS